MQNRYRIHGIAYDLMLRTRCRQRCGLQYPIAIGRSGEMPALRERLDETQIQLLVALLTPNSSTQSISDNDENSRTLFLETKD